MWKNRKFYQLRTSKVLLSLTSIVRKGVESKLMLHRFIILKIFSVAYVILAVFSSSKFYHTYPSFFPFTAHTHTHFHIVRRLSYRREVFHVAHSELKWKWVCVCVTRQSCIRKQFFNNLCEILFSESFLHCFTCGKVLIFQMLFLCRCVCVAIIYI